MFEHERLQVATIGNDHGWFSGQFVGLMRCQKCLQTVALPDDEDGDPLIFFVDHCRDAIRTLPMQQHDENRPEDLDTEGEDHAVDDIRYACMSRPFGARVEADEDLNPLMVKNAFRMAELSD